MILKKKSRKPSVTHIRVSKVDAIRFKKYAKRNGLTSAEAFKKIVSRCGL